ncbi:ACT domain-containing protein [Thermococcus chitonophagus]|nr:ACT domain-containing protein [Thermococcus chitonophagus]CUX78726.1 hypothetical protein CHITON_1947 [Thermococcus chitonophagus]
MEEEKKSIAKLVKDLVMAKPCVREMMILGVVNYSALARLFHEELEKRGIKASVGAIKMALIRLGEELSEERASFENAIKGVIAKTVIELQSDLVVITVNKQVALGRMNRLFEIMKETRFFQLSQGVDTFTIAIANEDKEKVLEALKDGVVDIVDGQTAIILISPYGIMQTPGIIAFITTALAINGINLTQVISCHKDTVLLVDRKDAPSAYRVLEDLILRMRES